MRTRSLLQQCATTILKRRGHLGDIVLAGRIILKQWKRLSETQPGMISYLYPTCSFIFVPLSASLLSLVLFHIPCNLEQQ
jgi:hypothetical protein